MTSDVKLYCLRHAESVANTNPHIIGGRSNETPLTELGIEQAKTLGRYLAAPRFRPDFIYASPAVRTLQTAHYALAEAGIDYEPTIDEALQEMDQGLWVGLNRHETYTPAVLKDIKRLKKDFKADDGESMNDTGMRKLTAVDAIADRHLTEKKPLTIWIFAHGMAIRCLASTIHNWSHGRTYKSETPNASISLFTRTDRNWQLRYLGRKPR